MDRMKKQVVEKGEMPTEGTEMLLRKLRKPKKLLKPANTMSDRPFNHSVNEAGSCRQQPIGLEDGEQGEACHSPAAHQI